MTLEEHLEARAEQLVEAMARRRWGNQWEYLTDRERREELELQAAALNVVRTERSRKQCPSCDGTQCGPCPVCHGQDDDCGECRGFGQVDYIHCPGCIDGSVPGELLVVGLIGEEVDWYGHIVAREAEAVELLRAYPRRAISPRTVEGAWNARRLAFLEPSASPVDVGAPDPKEQR